jgi:hypothetical protein
MRQRRLPDGTATMAEHSLCGARTRNGTPCALRAGWGTDHFGFGNCRFHFGATPNGRTHAIREQASVEAARLGVAVETDPHEALAAVVNILVGTANYLQEKVAQIDQDKGLDGDSLHPTVRALHSVLEQLQRAAKAAADAGVARRAIELDEAVVTRLAEAMRLAMADVDLTPAQEDQLRESLSRRLVALDGLDWRAPRRLAA